MLINIQKKNSKTFKTHAKEVTNSIYEITVNNSSFDTFKYKWEQNKKKVDQ